MRVIEQLVQHFWTRGALSREEALYLVKHGFIRESDLVPDETIEGVIKRNADTFLVIRKGREKFIDVKADE